MWRKLSAIVERKRVGYIRFQGVHADGV
jgi:hypothetical protein